MKKRKKIILIVISIVVGLFIICGNIDYHLRTKKGKPPIMAIYIGEDKDIKVKRWMGIGYFVTKCPDIEESEYVKTDNNRYKFSILFNHYVCVTSYDVHIDGNDYKIVDETKTCDTSMEEIARDNRYIYYLDCIKSETIFLEYENGDKITLKKALNKGDVSIYNLIDKGLEVYQKKLKK